MALFVVVVVLNNNSLPSKSGVSLHFSSPSGLVICFGWDNVAANTYHQQSHWEATPGNPVNKLSQGEHKPLQKRGPSLPSHPTPPKDDSKARCHQVEQRLTDQPVLSLQSRQQINDFLHRYSYWINPKFLTKVFTLTQFSRFQNKSCLYSAYHKGFLGSDCLPHHVTHCAGTTQETAL